MQSTSFVIGIFEFVLLIFSLSFHECAHAWMASRLGDQTARMQGRVTLNPMYHVDPFGTLLFPAIIIFGPFFGFSFFSGLLIGWAKPTPVITRNFRRIKRDDNLTTFAGPASNLLLVVIALAGMLVASHVLPNGKAVVVTTFVSSLRLVAPPGGHPILLLCSLAIIVNLSLFFFNLLPIPPLDGSHLVRNMLPYNAVQVYDRINGWISILLMLFVGGFIIELLLSPAIGIVYSILVRA
ncbi:MAG: site-2 protease family protein [Acidobacteriota bacterium]